MSGGTIENPILNRPYDPPEQYFELSPQGPTGVVKEGRRPSESLVPIPQSKKGTQAADGSLQPTLDVELTGERREHNALINDIRRAVEMWRLHGYDGVSPTTPTCSTS